MKLYFSSPIISNFDNLIISFEGFDTHQDNKTMTKDAHYERSSQHSSEDLTRRRNG